MGRRAGHVEVIRIGWDPFGRDERTVFYRDRFVNGGKDVLYLWVKHWLEMYPDVKIPEPPREKPMPPAEQPWTGTCSSCRSVIGAKRGELTVEDSSEGEFGRAKCPVCGADMVLYESRDGKPRKR